MNPLPGHEQKRIVASGYDTIADVYAAASRQSADPTKHRFIELAKQAAPAGSRLVDLGCGTGEAVTAYLHPHFQVTGVDISPRSIELARERVAAGRTEKNKPRSVQADVAAPVRSAHGPLGHGSANHGGHNPSPSADPPGPDYVVADMTTVEFASGSIDVVTAFFSMIHVPRDEHQALLIKIAKWLRPGGTLIATMGAGAQQSYTEDWLGAPMTWSHWDAETNKHLVRHAGFELISNELITEHDDPATHLWVVARKL